MPKDAFDGGGKIAKDRLIFGACLVSGSRSSARFSRLGLPGDRQERSARKGRRPAQTCAGQQQDLHEDKIEDLYNPPDWYPDIHPPMPQVVAHGNGSTVRACAACHLPTGTGHDELANIAGLPANYLIEQLADYKSGARKGSGTMTGIGKAITDGEVRDAATYFSSLKPRPWIRVVETDIVPKTFVGAGNKRLPTADGGTEPIGMRIIEIPETKRSCSIAILDPVSSPTCPRAASPGARRSSRPTAAKHGLRRLPRRRPTRARRSAAIAGRQATYVVRQLFGIRTAFAPARRRR